MSIVVVTKPHFRIEVDNMSIQGVFINWSAQKINKRQIMCKSLQKSLSVRIS